VVGVNKFRLENEDPVDVLKVDNSAVRSAQIERLKTLKASRDEAAVKAALAALTASAQNGQASGMETNLLALAVDAARAKATVGEISMALELVYNRHEAKPQVISNVYGKDFGNSDPSILKVRDMVARFSEREGQAPSIYLAKMGQDGHDRGQKVVATALADLGFKVVAGALFQTPEEAAKDAIAAGVQIVGVSSLAAGHLTLVPELRDALAALGHSDMMVTVGGVIPPQDFDALRDAGAKAIFPPGTVIPDAAAEMISTLTAHLGHNETA
jgi:methylmalonyl-CoA mutase